MWDFNAIEFNANSYFASFLRTTNGHICFFLISEWWLWNERTPDNLTWCVALFVAVCSLETINDELNRLVNGWVCPIEMQLHLSTKTLSLFCIRCIIELLYICTNSDDLCDCAIRHRWPSFFLQTTFVFMTYMDRFTLQCVTSPFGCRVFLDLFTFITNCFKYNLSFY